MVRRSGTTLIEVLIAIFVSAIGLLALLALFPIGALSMAEAIKNGKTAQAAANGAATAEVQQVRTDSQLYYYVGPTLKDFFTRPALTIPNSVPPVTLPDLSTYTDPVTGQLYDGPGYPVYMDPLGAVNLGVGRIGHLPVAPANSPGIRRRTVSYVSTTSQYLRWFATLDDITFDQKNGTGLPSGPVNPLTGLTVVAREGRYSWAYMLRRPKYSEPSVVDVSVVVYAGRSPAVLGETPYYVDWNAGSNTVTIYLNQLAPGQEKPPIKPGSWILDATIGYISPVTGLAVADPHGFFYQVVSVSDTTAFVAGLGTYVPALVLELQTPIKRGTPAGLGLGVLVTMDNVVQVVEKGSGWMP
jgi:hypothetical protein